MQLIFNFPEHLLSCKKKSIALVEGGGAEGEECILRSPVISESPISLLSMREVK